MCSIGEPPRMIELSYRGEVIYIHQKKIVVQKKIEQHRKWKYKNKFLKEQIVPWFGLHAEAWVTPGHHHALFEE